MADRLPTRLASTCDDCGTTMTLGHPDGIGGAELTWPCPVCLNPLSLSEIGSTPGITDGGEPS